MLSARALYSNISESPEELTFNQGDVLTVLQKDINGLSGWWLCFIDGRIGLAPGNRLRVLSHVEQDNEKLLEPGDPSSAQAASDDDPKRLPIVKDRNGIDPNDSQQIYDVPPIRNSSSPLPQVPEGLNQRVSDKSEIIYDVPPSSSAVNYDRLRRVEFTDEAEYQVPRPMRNISPISRESSPKPGPEYQDVPRCSPKPGPEYQDVPRSSPKPGPEYQDVPRSVPLNEPTCAPGVLPAYYGRNLSKDGEYGQMGNVRVCVEDYDEISSEESVENSTTRKTRGRDIARTENAISPRCESVFKGTENTDVEALESFHKRILGPTFHDPRFGGNSTTLPRTTEVGTRRNREGNQTLDQRCTDQKSYDQAVVHTTTNTTSSFPSFSPCLSPSSGPCVINKQLKVYDQRNSDRDSLLDDYSFPANWKTLPSPRYRPSSDPFSRQQVTTDLSPGDQQSLRDAGGKTRRAHSEVRSTGTSFHRPRSETKNGNEASEYHLSFVDTGIYVDCPQDPDSVSDMMMSLHQTVRCQAAAIRELCLGFEFSSNYTSKNEADITKMKMSCLSLRTAIKEFADLGTGVLANAMQSPTRDLSESILQQLEILRVFSKDLDSSVYSVMNASRGGSPIGCQMSPRDALSSLLTITTDIVLPLASLTDLVAKNSAVIFSAGKALSSSSVLPAIMDIRSSSPTVPPGQVAVLGTAREFRPLSPNIRTLFPASVVEMPPGSPNVQYIQNSPQGNLLVHGSVVRDGKHGFVVPHNPDAASLKSYGWSTPMLPVNGLSPDFRTASPIASASSSLSSNSPMMMVASAAPGKPDPTQYLQTRPLPSLPPVNGTISNFECQYSPTGISDDVSDWNSVESDYASIANEAERDMKQNVRVLVGRLTDRSKDSRFLQPDEASRTPGKDLGGLSPQFKERMDALRPTTEQTMKISCTGSRNNPSGSSSKEIAGFFCEFLTGIDREIIQFYAEEVRGHCDAVEFATDDFLGAVTDGSSTGSDLVAFSRHVVLAAHKLLYAGAAITKKLTRDEEFRGHVGAIAGELCARLKRTVAASKADADAGASLRRLQMVDCMTQVKLLSLKLKDLLFVNVFDRIM